jgi:hypothetical protein
MKYATIVGAVVCLLGGAILPVFAQTYHEDPERYVGESNPVEDSARLSERLNISDGRAQFIIVGERGRENVRAYIQLIDDFTLPEPGRFEYNCTTHGCSCHGDDDCNLMFTQVCADPSTNGSCTGEVCTCTP